MPINTKVASSDHGNDEVYNIKFVSDLWWSMVYSWCSISSTNNTGCHDIQHVGEIVLIVTLNNIKRVAC